MKKLVRFLMCGIVAFVAVSCDEGRSEENDILAIYPLMSDYHVVYADQTVDTVTIFSTRDWDASLSASWISMDAWDMYGKVAANAYDAKKVPVYFTENETDAVRYGALQINSNGKTVGHPFMQTYWLNIEEPEGMYTNDKTIKATFTEVIKKDETKATLAFTLYTNGTLSSDAAWANPDSTSFDAGYTETSVTCEANETGQLRTANLTLKTASGISTVIKLLQTPD